MDHDQTPAHDLASPLNPRRAMLAGLGGLAAGAFLASTANAGPLNPPPGPITSTPGPEPRIPIGPDTTPGTATARFRITQPGSYYLTANITGQPGRHGIEITANNVTVDLMGFELAGGAGSLDGIRTSVSGLRNITILNGTARDWGSSGVNLANFTATNGRIEGVNATGNSTSGIRSGISFTVSNCTASSNGFSGILAGTGSSVSNCASNNNGGIGIQTGTGCVITNCVAGTNSSHGFSLFGNSFASKNNAFVNGIGGTGAGIRITSSSNRIEGNNCNGNRIGIECSTSGNFIARNTCSGNLTQNWSIAANNKCLVINGTNAPAITGNSGGTSPGSTSPYANFTY